MDVEEVALLSPAAVKTPGRIFWLRSAEPRAFHLAARCAAHSSVCKAIKMAAHTMQRSSVMSAGKVAPLQRCAEHWAGRPSGGRIGCQEPAQAAAFAGSAMSIDPTGFCGGCTGSVPPQAAGTGSSVDMFCASINWVQRQKHAMSGAPAARTVDAFSGHICQSCGVRAGLIRWRSSMADPSAWMQVALGCSGARYLLQWFFLLHLHH